MFAESFFVAPAIAASIHLMVGVANVVEKFLSCFLVIDVGGTGVFSFTGYVFRSNNVAGHIGRSAGNPFQEKSAFAHLAFGTLGLMCIWIRRHFWTAIVHMVDIRSNGT